MDSIVDSVRQSTLTRKTILIRSLLKFFPILSSIDKEINVVDSLVLGGPRKPVGPPADSGPQTTVSSESSIDEKRSSDQLQSSLGEKHLNATEKTPHWRLGIRFYKSLFPLRRISRLILNAVKRRPVDQADESAESMTETLKTLLRIAAIRRIVTVCKLLSHRLHRVFIFKISSLSDASWARKEKLSPKFAKGSFWPPTRTTPV